MSMIKPKRTISTPFTPRPGMIFRENAVRNPRTVVLRESRDGGRRWRGENVINFYKVTIPTAKLHVGPYHDGWSRVYQPDELPEKFGVIV